MSWFHFECVEFGVYIPVCVTSCVAVLNSFIFLIVASMRTECFSPKVLGILTRLALPVIVHLPPLYIVL